MTDALVDALIVDLLHWLSSGERTYEEAMEAWRTSCPKLPIWEEAGDRGFVAQENFNGREIVRITASGFSFLQQRKATPQNTQEPGATRPA